MEIQAKGWKSFSSPSCCVRLASRYKPIMVSLNSDMTRSSLFVSLGYPAVFDDFQGFCSFLLRYSTNNSMELRFFLFVVGFQGIVAVVIQASLFSSSVSSRKPWTRETNPLQRFQVCCQAVLLLLLFHLWGDLSRTIVLFLCFCSSSDGLSLSPCLSPAFFH